MTFRNESGRLNLKLANSAANGAFVMLFGQWSKFTVQIAGTAILARILSPGDFGLVAMVTAIIGIAAILSDFGLSLAALRDPDMSHEDKSNLFWVNLIIGLLASAIIALTAGPISDFYGRPELKTIVLALSATFLLQSAAGQFRAELSRSLRFSRIVAIDVLAQLGATATAVTLALTGMGYWALVVQQVTIIVLQVMGLATLSGWLPQKPRNLWGTGKHIIFGSKASATQIINYVSSNADTVALGAMWGASTTGIYNQAYQFFKVPISQLASPLTNVMIPVLSRANDQQMLKYLKHLQSMLIYAIGGVFLILASVAPPLMLIILGPGWEGVAPVLQILAIGGIFQTLGYIYYWFFIVKDLVGSQLIFGGLARLVMVAMIIAFSPWGANGVAWAVTAGLAINWTLLTLFVVPRSGLRRRFFLSNSARPITILLGGLAGAIAVGHYLPRSLNEFETVSVLLVFWILYLGTLFIIVRPFRQDIAQIRIVVNMAKKRPPQKIR